MSLLSRASSFLKDLDQRIQLVRISFEDKNYRKYALTKFHKKECHACNGKGFVDGDQSL